MNSPIRPALEVMLAAMKRSLVLADDMLDKHYSGRTPECQECYDQCVAAVETAESALSTAERPERS